MTAPATLSPRVQRPEAGPLRRVLAALDAGAADRAELARATGLGSEVVDTALDHLVRIGRVPASTVSTSCPPVGCGGCPTARSGGASGCGAGTPAPSGAECALTLLRRRAE